MDDLECIICCVNYSDILKDTICYNIKIIKNITIITSPDDLDTISLCKKYKLNYIVTNLFYDKTQIHFDIRKCLSPLWWSQYLDNLNSNCFNKSKAINYGIKKTNKNWILLIDADIILPTDIKSLNLDNLSKNALYSCKRYVYDTKNEFLKKENGYYDKWQFVGFFQLFNKNSINFTKNYYGYDERFNYADKSDITFMIKWHEKKLLNFEVIHLGKTGQNWKGRVTDKW